MPDVSWYRTRAIEALTSLGAPDVDPAQLTDWAYTWWQRVTADADYPIDGVLITADGAVVGEAVNQDGAYLLTPETREKYGVNYTAADFGSAQIARHIGAPVRLVKSWEVAPRRKPRPQALTEIEDLRAQIDDLQTQLEYRVIEAFHTREETGITVKQLATAMGAKTRKVVYGLVERS